MTRDAFRAAARRLGLVAACSAYTLGLFLAGRYLGIVACLAATVGGLVVAAAVTLEPAAPPAPDEPPVEREGLSRAEIARRVRAR